MTDSDSLRFTLLDQQIVDAENRPVGRVDDVLLQVPDDGGPPALTHLLTGAQALGDRLGGVTGRVLARVAARLRPPGSPVGPTGVPIEMVGDHQDLVHLTVPIRDLPEVAGLERWLADQLVSHVPGAGDARN
jgi:predicted short-subunit dehydrogenase-like oxidoreductase (DUF2520 family)